MKLFYLLLMTILPSVNVWAKPIPEIRFANCSYERITVGVTYQDDLHYYEVHGTEDNDDVVHLPDGDVPGPPTWIITAAKVHYRKSNDQILFYTKDKDVIFKLKKVGEHYRGEVHFDGMRYKNLECVVWGF